ncbi:MAG TPA: alpha/beta hydrolase [Bacillota bacterium]
MNVSQLIADTHDLVGILLRRFHRKKVFVVGHSWGTMRGALTIQKFPELFYAYVGVGQVATPKANEELSKELIWFENSAHSLMYEEPGKFHDVLIQNI